MYILFNRNLLLSIVLLSAQTLGAGLAWANDDQAPTLREFLSSLSPAERKMPKDLVVQARIAAGQAVPAAARATSRSRSSRFADSEATAIVQITGTSAETLAGLLLQRGIEPEFVSPSRPYVTAALTEQEIWDVSLLNSVKSIRYVRGPIAQGTTSGSIAHRTQDFKTVAQSTAPLDTKLVGDGDGVVIGLISLPVKQADLNALNGVTGPRVIPLYDAAGTDPNQKLFLLDTDVISNESGSADALNMLQLIYDIAPNATVVMASPGATSTAGHMAATITALRAWDSGDSNDDRAVNVIVDDLLYPYQNPFEVGEVGEAMAASVAAGVLHISAAGDGGNHADNSGSTYFMDFDPETVSSVSGLLDKTDEVFLGFETVHKFGTTGVLTAQEALSDLCLFWSEKPDAAGDRMLGYLFSSTGTLKAFLIEDGSSPGGCLGDETVSFGATSVAADDYLVIEDAGGADNFRVAVVGYRATVDLSSMTKAFDVTTPGGILGHAYSENTTTIASTFFGTDTEGCGSDPVTNEDRSLKTCYGKTIAMQPFSADGEAADTQRFFWEHNGSAYQAASTGIAPAKPDIALVGSGAVKTVTSGAVDAGTTTYQGTSASAAYAAGVAALYWEYRREQIEHTSLTGSVEPTQLQQSLRASAISPARPADGTVEEPAVSWNNRYGYGVMDAPRVIEAPGRVLDLTLVAQIGSATLNYNKALNDLSDLFIYEVDCGSWYATTDNESTLPEDSPAPSGATEGYDQAPIQREADIGEVIDCTITTSHSDPQVTTETSSVSISVTAPALQPPVISLTAGAGGAVFTLSASPSAATGTALTYTAACTIDGDAEEIGNENEVVVGQSYDIEAAPGATITCAATATAAGFGGADDLTATTTGDQIRTVTSAAVQASTITLTPDSGGFSVRITKDGSLVNPSRVTTTVTCEQNGSPLPGANGQVVTGTGLSIETESQEEVTCSATSTYNYTNSPTPVTVNFAGGTNVVTPEEYTASGLPVWLLYIATQPE